MRLDSEAPDLAERLRSAGNAGLRAVADKIAAAAVAAMKVSDPRIDAGLHAAAARDWGNTAVRADLEKLTEELDEIAWDIQEQAEEGTATEAEYETAFRRARAVAALCFSLESDAATAASESVYEAWHALDNPDVVRDLIDEALDS
jgi:hypothetical protein